MGIPVDDGGEAGSLVTVPGQVQYGAMLLGGGTSAGWKELINWRALPDAQTSDSPRPQAHGSYPGDVFGDELVITFNYQLRGRPDDKQAYVDLIERYTPMDGVDRPLVVNDGSGPWVRMARVIGRNVPQDHMYRHGPLDCSVQFLCADPRRYALASKTFTVNLPSTSGGLVYPLVYPLTYGVVASGSVTCSNDGSESTMPVVKFYGPLTDPILTTPGWSLGFRITLVSGDTLTVDTDLGTAKLNDTADRLYTIRTDSDPLELCSLPPGATALTLTSAAGSGRVEVTYNDARM